MREILAVAVATVVIAKRRPGNGGGGGSQRVVTVPSPHCEAPLKFRAPGITRELGLGIGRLVFKALNASELVLAVAVLLLLLGDEVSTTPRVGGVLLLAIVAIQAAMIHIVMDKRAARIVQGETLSESRQHIVYIVLEIMKAVLLIFTGTMVLRQIAG